MTYLSALAFFFSTLLVFVGLATESGAKCGSSESIFGGIITIFGLVGIFFSLIL